MKIISIILFAIILLVLTYFILGIATILKNGTSIVDKPGSVTRIKRFLSTNSANTQENSSFPELETRRYNLDISDKAERENVFEAIKSSAIELGYEFDSDKSDGAMFHFTITTKLFKFVDDLEINLQKNSDGISIDAHSSSRKGRADFGANIANIRKFFVVLEKNLAQN